MLAINFTFCSPSVINSSTDHALLFLLNMYHCHPASSRPSLSRSPEHTHVVITNTMEVPELFTLTLFIWLIESQMSFDTSLVGNLPGLNSKISMCTYYYQLQPKQT